MGVVFGVTMHWCALLGISGVERASAVSIWWILMSLFFLREATVLFLFLARLHFLGLFPIKLMENPDSDCLAIQAASPRHSPSSLRCIYTMQEGHLPYEDMKKVHLAYDDLRTLAIHLFKKYFLISFLFFIYVF